MVADLEIEVTFLRPEDGGRTTSIRGGNYGCPIMIENEGFDCRFVVAQDDLFEPGESYIIPVKLMNFALASEQLTAGRQISLWEGRTIAHGKVRRHLR
jgi:hypothetical protein